LTLGSVTEYLPAVGGLILGGVIVAPFSAYLCKKVPVKPLIAVLGVLIVAVNAWKFVTAIMG
ncbi:MAG: sulfite exporter TauE/SafE family protein, partial [Clostridia bacterium]|nr:sulfite exporter TauE/SafE family protein [Clostridia bacterium]